MIRAAWVYRDIMPVVPVLDAGLTPLMRWMVVPSVTYFLAIRLALSQLFSGGRK